MLTGSLASSYQGIPRATHDIDLVVDMVAHHVEPLIIAFPPPRFYLDRTAVFEAVRVRGHFNLLDTNEGDKIDFWLLTVEPFDQSRFARRQKADIGGLALDIGTPEDTILMKLSWAMKSGGSERQHLDAKGVFEVQFATLDMAYIDFWAAKLGIGEAWRQLRACSPALGESDASD